MISWMCLHLAGLRGGGLYWTLALLVGGCQGCGECLGHAGAGCWNLWRAWLM